MNHIPRIRDPRVTLKPVPYYGQGVSRYTGPFTAFNNELTTLQSSNKCSRKEISGVAQKWLFFGLMKEFFAVFETPFIREDFIREEGKAQHVSTEALHDYVVALIVQEHMRRQDPTWEKKGIEGLDADDLAIARGHLDHSSGLSRDNYEEIRLLDWLRKSNSLLVTAKGALERLSALEVDPAVWDSILVTTAALARIVDIFLRPLSHISQAVHYPVDLGDFHLRTVPDLRQSPDWCPNKRKVLEQFTSGQPEEVMFFSQLRRSDERNHSQCTASECVAHQIDSDYVTVHDVATCTNEACSTIEYSATSDDETQAHQPSTGDSKQTAAKSDSYFDVKTMASGLYESIDHMVDELTKEVDALTFVDGQLQAVKIPLTKSRMSSSIGMPIKGWNLVAFSHVWSDGLGNRETNALPACQLKRLQDLANGLYSQRSHPVPFWIDTLMIPIVPSNLTGEEKHIASLGKKVALRNMEWVYKGASKVLVLDSTLYDLDTAGMSSEERGARIMTSTWSRRLWTLQEGCMKDRTFFQFRDGAISWPTLHNEVLQAASISDWRRKHSLLPRGHSIRKLQKLPLVQYNGKQKTINGMQADITSPMWQAKEKLDKLLFRAINPVWCVVRNFLEDMSVEWSGGELRGEALRRCMRSMYYRNCTNKTDEGLVLASLLSAKPGAAANLFYKTKHKDGVEETGSAPTLPGQETQADGTTQPEARRTQPSLQVEPEDRLLVLFSELDVVPVDLLFADHPRYQDRHCHWIPTSLLSVNAPSAPLLRRSEHLHRKTTLVRRKANVVCKVTPKGLEIGLDGLRVQSGGTVLHSPFSFELDKVRYSVHLREPGTGNEITAKEAADWIVIPETLFASSPRQCKAILVKVREWWPRRPGGEAEFSCLAVLTRMDDGEATGLPEYEVKRFERTKPWKGPKACWKGAVDAGKRVVAEGVWADDKWVVG